MKIAFHILAHNQFELLDRLINKLQHPNSVIFVHIDAKSKFDFSKLNFKYKNCFFYSKFKVFWFGFSMVEATLYLLKKSLESGFKFKYHVLLSGQDYPIKSLDYIFNFFSSNNCDFIHYEKFSCLDDVFFRKFEMFHFYDNFFFNPKSDIYPKIKYYNSKIYNGFYMKYFSKLIKRSFPYDMKPYFGSQWFSLTDSTVRFIFDFINKNSYYVKFMKYTEGPDEFFFQSILANTEVAKNLTEWELYSNWNKTNFQPYRFKLSSLKYMDWESLDREKPAILDIRDFENIIQSEFLFCRKVDLIKSESLLDKLDIIHSISGISHKFD